MVMSWVSLQALSGQAVDHTVLFSSIAALTGPAGSSNYAAVNASLEAASNRLHSQGRQLPSYLHCPNLHHSPKKQRLLHLVIIVIYTIYI